MLYTQMSHFFNTLKAQFHLSDAAIEQLMEITQEFHYKKNDFIVRDGDKNNTTNFVVEGSVKSYVVLDGKIVITGLFKKGEMLGTLPGTNDCAVHTNSFVALETTSICCVNRRALEQLFNLPSSLRYWAEKW